MPNKNKDHTMDPKTLKLKSARQRPSFPEMEELVLEYWERVNAFEKSVNERPKDKPYVFYDGPPFATGLPHYGHILASTTKDVIPRYFTMKGYRVNRVWGWDCHGLPLENIIEKELDLKDKQAIEDYGIDKFNEACRSAVLRYADEWKVIIRRLGRWVDMENDYKTMESWYMESLWWVFKKLWEKGLIYKGHKSMHICPRCSTPLSNFEVTQGYKTVKDISVYVEFKLTSPEKLNTDKDVYVLAWTTTPWTLPGNVLLAFHPDFEYVLVESQVPGNQYLLAKERLEAVFGEDNYTIVKSFTGSELADLEYKPLFPYFSDTPNAFKTVTADFVTLDEGTGIVHIAPGFGQDDYELGKKEAIPLFQHVNMDGRFTSNVTDFAGLPVKPKDNPLQTDIKLLKYLQKNDLLFKKENVKHSYPHCWRCDTPLINYATDSWFVKVSQFKDQLLKNNQKINWIPEHIKDGRFGNWLEGAVDWAISRNRYWGTPLPVWESDDGDTICVESIKELEALTGETVDDLHKHVIDDLVIEKDGKEYRRIPEVLDCWFESGAMPYASVHYPFENKSQFEHGFPAEFISEGQDQTRGWFYTLHVLATALTLGEDPAIPAEDSTSAFKNCVVTGIVLAEDGKKMSKRLKNYPDPMVVGNKYGIDSLRLYLMSSPVVRADNLNFSEEEVEQIRRKVFNIFWNVYVFYTLYNDGKSSYGYPNKPSHVLDKWLISETQKLTQQVQVAMESYDIVRAARLLMEFVDDFSTWWLRLSRDRIRDSENNQEVLQVFRTTLMRWSLLMAPFAPFFTEVIYQNVHHDPKDSIHLELMPEPDESAIHPQLQKKMAEVRKAVEKIHAIRKEAGIQTRQPLSSVTVTSPVPSPKQNLLDVLAKEVNVKKVSWQSGDALEVKLDTTITPALEKEGQAREIMRQIQRARKKAGTKLDEWVRVELPQWPKEHEQEIKERVLAKELKKGKELTIIRLNDN